MKILIVQEKGRHKKNENFREALNFSRAFSKLNIDSTVWGLNYNNYANFDNIIYNHDIIFILENYDTGWLPDFSKYTNKLKIFWSIDSHVTLNSHLNICKKNKVNIVLNSIESDSKHFNNYKTYYFPNAYPDDLIYPIDNVKKTIDVGFVGNYLNRKDWLNVIPNININVMLLGYDMVKKINSFKIHFNRNLSNDINYRTFETLGCKTFLLTNYTENLDALFNVGDDLVVYDTKKDLVEKINYYLNNETERKRIEHNGFNTVKNNHTYINRVITLLDIIKQHI